MSAFHIGTRSSAAPQRSGSTSPTFTGSNGRKQRPQLALEYGLTAAAEQPVVDVELNGHAVR